VDKITITGNLIDPDIQKLNTTSPENEANFCHKKKRGVSTLASGRRCDSPSTCRTLRKMMVHVSLSDTSVTGSKRGGNSEGASLCKASLISYNKFKLENIAQFIEYRHWLDVLFGHTKYNLDEKYIVNSDAAPHTGAP
jgi:hypothetical protein